MAELCLELGMEELPASFVERAFGQLREEICARLAAAHLTHGDSHAMGTPRRLIIRVDDIAPMQPDRSEEQRGPALKAAYDPDGNPTKALEGFCRSQGVSINSLRKDDTYVWATKHIAGRPAGEVLSEIIPAAIRALTFDKSMRWGAARMRFARPIRWILAILDGTLVPFSVETVSSGTKSRGHRFNAPEEFEVTRWSALIDELRQRQVEPDPAIRRERIVSGAKAATQGTPEMTEALIDENVYLTEWPQAVEGEFKSEFLGLPEPVLVTAMAKHERFFPVRDASGQLTNRFISIRNGGEESTVRAGNGWVLNARFNDAKFFFDGDQTQTMAEFLASTERMLFQEKLGTVRQRADRLSSLAGWMAELAGGNSSEIEQAQQAGLYLKADLSSGLVSELSSLQGIVGAEYGLREGMHVNVAEALATQYAPEKARGLVARCAIAADQLDKLAGYLGLGLAPSGSSDPYGLRRAVTVLIDLPGFAGSWTGPFRQALSIYAQGGHSLDASGAESAFAEVFAGRYKALMPEVRYDLLEAGVRADDVEELCNPNAVRFRLAVLTQLASDAAFVQTATRPLNIVAAAEKKGIEIASEVNAGNLDSAEGNALFEAVQNMATRATECAEKRDPMGLAAELRTLASPINTFFDTTMVMVEDESVRSARLALLALVSRTLTLAGDWTKIVLE